MSFRLRPYDADADAPAVRALWTSRFGAALPVLGRWLGAAGAPDGSVRCFVAVAATPTARVVGVGVLAVGGAAYVRSALGLDVVDAEVALAARVGLFHLCAVHPAREGRGVATALFDRRLHALRETGVSQAVGVAWHRSRHRDSRPLFARFGFEPVTTVPRFYQRVGDRLDCPDCGDACQCTATLYSRTLPAPAHSAID